MASIGVDVLREVARNTPGGIAVAALVAANPAVGLQLLKLHTTSLAMDPDEREKRHLEHATELASQGCLLTWPATVYAGLLCDNNLLQTWPPPAYQPTVALCSNGRYVIATAAGTIELDSDTLTRTHQILQEMAKNGIGEDFEHALIQTLAAYVSDPRLAVALAIASMLPVPATLLTDVKNEPDTLVALSPHGSIYLLIQNIEVDELYARTVAGILARSCMLTELGLACPEDVIDEIKKYVYKIDAAPLQLFMKQREDETVPIYRAELEPS